MTENMINKLFPLWFQDPSTPIMEGIVDLHNYIFFYITLVLFFVLWVLVSILFNFSYKLKSEFNEKTVAYRYLLLSGNSVTHGTILEIVWTLIPSFILMAVAIPSFALLYAMDEIATASLMVKVIGHQWYWSYEYNNFTFIALVKWPWNIFDGFIYHGMKFDSYMLAENDLSLGQLRLLETDNAVVLPIKTHIRIIVTAADVLHSWAVPSLGIKVDAVPGRLSQVHLFIKRKGVFYGQCSEICGVNHGFMPIVVKAVKMKKYVLWALVSKNAIVRTDY